MIQPYTQIQSHRIQIFECFMLITILIATKIYRINSLYTNLQTRAVLIKYGRTLVEPLGHHLKIT